MLVPCFDLLYIPKVMHIWRQVYYCHFVFVAAGCVLFFALKPYLRSIQKRRVKVGQVDSLQVKKQL
jgi:lysophospholipid acyltransferase